jgi:hypothetical protein
MFNQMPQFNPYADRIAQLQAQQQQLQASQNMATLGKVVESIDVLKALDVNMDGNVYYFPKADGTEIYTKQWLPNGTTRILTFKPSLDNGVDENTLGEEKLNLGHFNDVLIGIQNEIQTINSKIDKISKPSTSTRGKKEVNEDE